MPQFFSDLEPIINAKIEQFKELANPIQKNSNPEIISTLGQPINNELDTNSSDMAYTVNQSIRSKEMSINKKFEFSKGSDYSPSNLQKVYSELKQDPDFIPTPESMQHLSLKLLELSSSTINETSAEQIALINSLLEEMKKHTIIDEVHHPLKKDSSDKYTLHMSNHDSSFIERFKQKPPHKNDDADRHDEDDTPRPKI